MALRVFSASFVAPVPFDAISLNITRDGGGRGVDPLGVVFAPTAAILEAFHQAQDEVRQLRRDAADISIAFTGFDALALLARAERVEREGWEAFTSDYSAEMRVCAGMKATSPRWTEAEERAVGRGVERRPEAWKELLRRAAVMLRCSCVEVTYPVPRPLRCHRRLLAGFLAAMLAKDEGEVEALPR